MMKEKIRIIDILSEEEKRQIEECEENIILARTPIGVIRHRKRAEHIMALAKERYKNSQKKMQVRY